MASETPAPAPAQVRRGWRRLRHWLVRGTVSLLLPLLAAEGILRLVYREEEIAGHYWGAGAFVADERFGYTHAPGFDGHAARRGQFRVPIEINEHGLRQRDFDAQAAMPRRLLLLGASYVFGLGVLEEENFVSLLADAMNPEGVGVINAGQFGYGVEQSTLFGHHWLERVAPDRVIVGIVPTHDTVVDFDGRWRAREVVHGMLMQADRAWPFAWNDWLRAHSYLFMASKSALEQLSSSGEGRAFRQRILNDQEASSRPLLEALTGLRDACQERGIGFGILLIGAGKVNAELDGHYEAAFRAAGIPNLRCGPPDFGPECFFSEDAHWNAAGHRRAADRVRAFLPELD